MWRRSTASTTASASRMSGSTGSCEIHLADKAALFQIDHPHDHGPSWIEGDVFEAPASIEFANLLVDRMREHAEAPDLARCAQCRCQREQQQRTRVALSLIGVVDRQLPQQRRRYGIGLVALMRLGEELAFDLGGAQGHVTDDQLCAGIADDAGARNTRRMIVPCMPMKPSFERVSPAIELAAIIV